MGSGGRHFGAGHYRARKRLLTPHRELPARPRRRAADPVDWKTQKAGREKNESAWRGTATAGTPCIMPRLDACSGTVHLRVSRRASSMRGRRPLCVAGTILFDEERLIDATAFAVTCLYLLTAARCPLLESCGIAYIGANGSTVRLL